MTTELRERVSTLSKADSEAREILRTTAAELKHYYPDKTIESHMFMSLVISLYKSHNDENAKLLRKIREMHQG